MKTIVLCERGINGWQSICGAWQQWPNEAVAWIHNQTVMHAQTLAYFTLAPVAGMTRARRARGFAELLRQYTANGWRIIVIAHSEGTATVLEALRQSHWPEIDELHLVCGACDSDFDRNGLNAALAAGNLGQVTCYRADRDWAMKLEDTLLGLLMFGISWNDLPLGLSGPVNVTPKFIENGQVSERHWRNYGHSDCWNPCNFDSTLRQILNLETA